MRQKVSSSSLSVPAESTTRLHTAATQTRWIRTRRIFIAIRPEAYHPPCLVYPSRLLIPSSGGRFGVEGSLASCAASRHGLHGFVGVVSRDHVERARSAGRRSEGRGRAGARGRRQRGRALP